MRVRRATIEDIPVITRLAEQLGGAVDLDGLPQRLKRILDHAHHAVFVAERDLSDDGLASEPCGFVAAEHRILLHYGELIEVMSLTVDEDCRRQGVGTQLVAAVEAWAARRGVPRVRVRSSVTREGSHDFYPAIGYALEKTQHCYQRSLP